MRAKLEPRVYAVSWNSGALVYLDQSKLPSEEVYVTTTRYQDVVDAIKKLKIRGAPAIGIAGAYAVALITKEATTHSDKDRFIENALLEVKNARPTAVNLRWAVERISKFISEGFPAVLQEAKRIHDEDIECNQRIAYWGAQALGKCAGVLTCCNTGDLATGGIGTALGVIREGFNQKQIEHVYSVETRPVLQGLRLTTWELEKNKIPFTAICDNMAASLMQQGKIQAVITGADRISANGDSANKIGTYSLAVLAHHHKIPFFIAAPYSTFDLALKSGAEIPIEQREGLEVLSVFGANLPNYPISVYNPSFDVTPRELITAIICDKGVIERPSTEMVKKVLEVE